MVSTLTSSYSDGSNATLHCNTKLHPTVDTGINVTVKWMRSEMIVFTTMAVFSNGSYWSSFNIDRVNSTTAGEYNCSFTVNDHSYWELQLVTSLISPLQVYAM